MEIAPGRAAMLSSKSDVIVFPKIKTPMTPVEIRPIVKMRRAQKLAQANRT